MGEPQPGEGEYVGVKVVADFFAECEIPTEAIPDLLKKCDPGSTWPDWLEVANEWRLAHGQGRIFSSHPAASTASEPLHKTRAEVLAYALEQQRLLATASDDSPSMLIIGQSAVKGCLRSIRAMGEVPPHIPDTLPDIESVRKAVDQFVAWAKAMDTDDERRVMLKPVNAAIRILDNHSSLASGGNGRILPTAYHYLLRKPITDIVASVLQGNEGLSDGQNAAFRALASSLKLDTGAWVLIANTPGVVKWPPVNIPCELATDPALFDRLNVALSGLGGAKSTSSGDLIERLLAGPDDAELTPRELALLEAHLRQRVSMSTMAQPQYQARQNKLRLIRDFNRNLQAAVAGPAPTSTGAPNGNADLAPLPPAKTEQGEGNGGAGSTPEHTQVVSGANREALLRQLQPADRKAYLAYQYAETMNGKRLTDREAYDWVKENGIDSAKDDVGELADYVLRAFDTWTKQLRNARKPLGEQKYTPRGGRSRGRSVAKSGEI